MGRPSKISTIKLEQVKALGMKGWTDVEMSDFFNVTKQTWNNYKKKHQKFFYSLKDSKAIADNTVKKSLFERANGYDYTEVKTVTRKGEVVEVTNTVKHYLPDPTSMIFWLTNRQPDNWKRNRDEQGSSLSDEHLKALTTLAIQTMAKNL